MTPPLVTIAIPTYNRAHQLVRALGSAVAQDYANVEILVCDNASTDHTVGVVEAVGDPRVRLVRSEINRGPICNFRRGLELAKGEYFMWLADDDWIDPDFVSRCVACLVGDPMVALANGDVRYVGAEGAFRLEPAMVLTARRAGARIRRYYRRVARNGAFYGISRTDTRRHAPLDATMASDWLHVAAIAARGSVVAAPTTMHRAADGVSASLDYRYFRTIAPMAAKLGLHTARHPAFDTLSGASRAATVLAAMVLVLWRFGPARLVDRAAGVLVKVARPRLSPSTYSRLRTTYRRVRVRQVPLSSDAAERVLPHA